MNRRGFFATLLAPFVARFRPKPEPTFEELMREYRHALEPLTDLFFAPNPLFVRLKDIAPTTMDGGVHTRQAINYDGGSDGWFGEA